MFSLREARSLRIAVPSHEILLERYLAAMTSNPSEVRDQKALDWLHQE